MLVARTEMVSLQDRENVLESCWSCSSKMCMFIWSGESWKMGELFSSAANVLFITK